MVVAAVAVLATSCGGSSHPSGRPGAAGPPSVRPSAPTPTSPTSPPPSPAPTRVTHSPRPSPSATTTPPRPSPSYVAKPRYVFPVQRCHSDYSSSHHDYPASDIFTQKGCAFVAATSGWVDEVSATDRWDPQVDDGDTRGGLSVSIIGDDGVRYYGSHLERIAAGIRPGARVRAGRLLGLIDNSGDAKYTATHVHFGISWPTRHGVWWVRRGEVWPQRYLASWRAGGNLSPAAEVGATERRMGRVPRCQAEC
jgi:peptidoglycan LD-endopeptidase LytH